MKKLLSICFLSILLGLMSFSMRAQSSGFWIENLNPVTVDGVVNAPDGSGTLVLNNTLNVAKVDSVDLYELHFCTEVPDSLKISVDWLLYRNGQLVNGNLSDYAEIDMYTWYPELNNQGNAMAIHWVGGRLPNAFGYCDQPVQPDMFSGYDCGHAPTNYPGALLADYAAPRSVFNALGEYVSSQGLYSLYTEAFDYFYAKFFQYGRTVVQIKWKQVGNYSLVMRIRERHGGTDWDNAYYNNDELLHAGGHMSCCGEVLASDSIHYLVTGEFSKEVCQDAVPFTYGNPPYDFYTTIEDTNVVFGHNDSLHCNIFVVDSIIDFHFFVRNNPEIAAKDTTLCKCDIFNNDALLSLITVDPTDLTDKDTFKIQWYYTFNDAQGHGVTDWTDQAPDVTNLGVGTHEYIIRQVNTYNDTLDCIGNPDTFYITVKEMIPPTITPGNRDFCLEAIDGTTKFTATATLPDPNCANTTKWYTMLNSQIVLNAITNGDTAKQNTYSIVDSSLVYTGNNLSVDLINYLPSKNIDTVLYFFATSYKDVEPTCESPKFTFVMVNIHQTPELAKVTIPAAVNCPGDTVTMKVKINNNPDNTDTLYTYIWKGITTTSVDSIEAPAVEVTVGDETTMVTTKYLPLYSLYNKSYSQQIFTPAEVGTGIITKIALQNETSSTFESYIRNVNVYLALSDGETFSAPNVEWCTEGMQLVYSGNLDCNQNQQGWLEIPFTTSFKYDGSKNLVVVVQDNSTYYKSGIIFKSNVKTAASLYAYSDNLASDPAQIAKNRRNIGDFRDNIKFFVQPIFPPVADKNQEAYFNIPDTAKCNDQYTSIVYVVDGNGCVSQPDTFNYGVGVLHAPEVRNVPTAPVKVYACELNANNTPAYTSIEAIEEAGIEIIDDCGKGMSLTSTQTMYPGDCHDTLVRVYTIHNLCDSTVSFTQTFISYDTVKPEFRAEDGTFPYVRIYPLAAGDCKFNAPDTAAFIDAVKDYVYDNCTDSAYLMSTIKFFWENTKLCPIADTNIFRERNHLTVTAVINDICNNFSDTTLVIYLDRPDTMSIDTIHGRFDAICFGDSVTLSFDSAKVYTDPNIAGLHPYHFEWFEVNNKPVRFSNPNDVETVATPLESGLYTFKMRVGDNNGCPAVESDIILDLNVHAAPNIHIVHDVRNGATEPYCPTYGNMTVKCVDIETGAEIPGLTYTWTGESVNEYSETFTTWVTIIPDSCKHNYPVQVYAVDEIGCSAIAYDTIHVADTVGPQIADGTLPVNYQMEYGDNCVLTVPNFLPLLNQYNVTDNCYSYSQLTITQSPAAGQIVNSDTTVTITLSSPCSDAQSAYQIRLLKPQDYVKVNLTVAGDSVCENDPDYIVNGVTFTAHVTDGTPDYTYVWVKGNVTSTDTLVGENGAYITVHDTAVNHENSVYTYSVLVEDAHGCPVSASADMTVFFKGDPAKTRVWPRTDCDVANGALVVDEAPTGYTYVFQDVTKISDVPEHQTTPWNTIVFDNCMNGDWILTIITPDGCETTKLINIPEEYAPVGTVVAVPTPVSNCRDNNGVIDVTIEAGYTYYMSSATSGTDLTQYEVITNGHITGLSQGTYHFYRVNNATNCPSAITDVEIVTSSTAPSIAWGGYTSDRYCLDTIGDGKIKISTTSGNNVYYTMSLGATIVSEGMITSNTIVENLISGKSYTITAIDTMTGCASNTLTNVYVPQYDATPTASISADNNYLCFNGKSNAYIKLTRTGSYDFNAYIVRNGSSDTTFAPNTFTTANNNYKFDSVYVGSSVSGYSIYLISTPYNCTKKYNQVVYNKPAEIKVTGVATINNTCDTNALNGSVTITISRLNTTIATSRVKGYKFRLYNDNYDSTVYVTSGNSVTFNGLWGGLYNMEAMSTFGCEAFDTITVPQRELELAMTTTPNTMCVSTFEKPGNGSIIVTKPRNAGSYTYTYKYFDANDSVMEVPYDQPISYTKYWLKEGLYRVAVVEYPTLCTISDTITVPADHFNVTISDTTTPNKYCTKHFDGTITINATSANPDAILMYSIDSVNWQFNNVFTGLKDGHYRVFVLDTNTACVFEEVGGADVQYKANDITITPTITPDHACEGGTHDGTLSVVASTTTFDNTYFMFKFQQDADYSTTSSWTGLNSSTLYNVTVIDTISGCTVDSIFSIPLENVCAPIITINGNNKFCLNAEDAQICATATNNTDVCPEGNYQFMWVIRCHHDTVYSQCVDVNTSSVHNCFYDLYVKDLNTGCVSSKSIEVEILPINQVNFTINHAPFYAIPRTYEHCVADSVWVGVQKDKWVSVLWSNSYVTPEDKKPLDLEFCVLPNTNNPNHLYSYCVDAIDSNGCPARSEINLWANPVPTNTVYDTACYQFTFGNEIIYYSDDVQYPITRTQVFPRVDNKHCDSVVTHQIVIYPHVYANFDTVTKMLQNVYCAPTNILSELKDSVKYNHGTLSVEIWNGINFRPFTQLDNLTLNYADSTFRFVVDGYCEDKYYDFQISMDKAPQVDTFKLDSYYCASSQATFNAVVSEFSKTHGFNTSSSYVKMYFANDEAHPFACTNTTNKVNGELQKFYFNYTPTMADRGRKIVTKVWNNCGFATDTCILVVDTTYIIVPDVELCENDTLNFASILGNQVNSYDNLQAYLIPVTGAHATIPSVIFVDITDTMANHGFTNNTNIPSTNSIDDNISFSGNVKYQTSNSTVRLNAGNNFTINAAEGYKIKEVTLNCTQVSATLRAYLDGSTTTTTFSTNDNNVTVSGINASEVKFTNTNGGPGSGYLSTPIVSVNVKYTNVPDNTPIITYEYGNAEAYTPGTELGLAYDRAKIYFTGHGKCGDITSDTANVTVNPNLVFDPMGSGDVCIDEAVDFITNNTVYIDYADTTCWLYAKGATDTILNEGFENFTNWDAIGWQIFDADEDNENWYVIDPSSDNLLPAHTGSKVVSSWSYDLSAMNPDNWLISPAISIPANGTLTFYDQGNWDYPDHYSVYVSTTSDYQSINNNNLVGSFTTSNVQEGYYQGIWTKRTIDLSSYVGQTVYVAFRHHASYDNNFLFIDDIIIDGRELVPVKNVAELVDSIKNMPQADVYFYAANGCDTLLEEVGTFRILDTVKLTASSISVCPNDDLSDITLALNASIIDYGNYRTNEIKPVAVGNDGNLYDLNSHVALNTVLYNGQIRIVATATNAQQPIDFCAIDTAKATITVLTNGFKQDTLQKACDATAFVNFIKAAPVWTGSVNVQNDIEHQFWTVTYTQNQVTTSKVITTDSIMYASKHPSVQYTWITDCGDTLRTTAKTLEFYTNPELTLTPDTVHICLNDTLFINNLGFGLYDPDEITKGHDTVWTLLGETVTDYVVATEAMNGAALYATIESTCETAFDSIIVMVDTLPVVTITGPERACTNTDVTFIATPGFDTYQFFINDVETTVGVEGNKITTHVTTDSVDFVYANVIVTDGNQCKASAADDAATRVTAMPQFIFFDSTGMANATSGVNANINGGTYDPADETHHFTATTGNGMKYVWMVNNECYNPDTLVYVEYDFYFNGRKISNDSIDDWYLIPSTYNFHGQSPLWVTSNQIYWEANDHTAKNNIAYYNYAYGDPSIYVSLNEYGGNHYPNTNMGFSNSNVYDDLWMHFLAGRPVTQEISGFRRQGEYKVVFRLYATSNPNKFYHPYTHTNEDGTTETMYIGGSNANANDAIITLLAMDSITIDVTGEDIIDPSVINPNDAPEITPELAPELVVDETVAPDMEVWPNPAPATETTLKARVHNMSGNATVTLTNLNGKQVYNGNIYIDNDNFYFEVGVNNLSVGSYIMTVRTQDAVITKKVVVTVSR